MRALSLCRTLFARQISRCDLRPVDFGVLFATALLTVWSGAASASLAIYVGKNLTEDGSVLLAGFGDEPSSHWLTLAPRRQYPVGATIKVGGTNKADFPGELIDIPQVGETYRYLSMDYSFYDGLPAPLTNGGMNEFGVAVRDVALFSRQELRDLTPKLQRGLNYSDVARIALERGRTAQEAVTTAISLIEKYGDFTYGGNSHVFADPNEGWVLLEFAGGKNLWVAQRLGPDDVWLNWRGYSLLGYVQSLPPDWRTNKNYMASANFVSFAEQRGWHKPASGKPFNLIEAYVRPDRSSKELIADAQRVESALRAAAPHIGPQLLMRLLHGVGKDSSGYAQVAHLRANIDSNLRTLWIAPGPPTTAAFIPWRIGVESIPPEYRRHRYLTAGEADRHFIDPVQRGLESTLYANRAVKRLLYLVQEHPAAFLPEVNSSLEAFEAREIAEQPDVERTAQILLDANQAALARRYLTIDVQGKAHEGLELIQDLATGIEARTRAIYGIRPPEATGPAGDQF